MGYVRETSEKSGEIGEAKFGHSVEEKIIERETPLKESDFEKFVVVNHFCNKVSQTNLLNISVQKEYTLDYKNGGLLWL